MFVSVNEEDVMEISRTTGIMADPVYKVKAIRGMLHKTETNSGRFKGHRKKVHHLKFSTSDFEK